MEALTAPRGALRIEPWFGPRTRVVEGNPGTVNVGHLPPVAALGRPYFERCIGVSPVSDEA